MRTSSRAISWLVYVLLRITYMAKITIEINTSNPDDLELARLIERLICILEGLTPTKTSK